MLATHSVHVVCSWPVLDTLLLWIGGEENKKGRGEMERDKGGREAIENRWRENGETHVIGC